MKKITYLLMLLLANGFCYGQTKLAELTFETPEGYSTNVPEFTDQGVSTGRDYFIRTDGSTINGEVFLNRQGSYYFAAQDIDGEGATLPVRLLVNNINVSGYASLEFRVHLAEDDDGANEDWDNTGGNPDYVRINYDIDNTGTFSNLLWIGPNGAGTNNEPAIDSDFDGTGDGAAITDSFTQFTQSIAGTGTLLDIEILFNLNAGDEDIAIDNIEIWGTLVPCNPAVTWDGSAWSNGTGPDINTSAILTGDYNTSTDGGSFSACNLTVSNSATLLIADNYYVETQNDVTVDALCAIDVQPLGAFIQNSDLGAVVNNGTMSVDKVTAPMDHSDEYTYWSSPVSGETFIGAVADLNLNKCYTFNGQNFLDASAETGNNNATVPGQDDIDDDFNDWVQIGSSAMMQPGIGYATTISDFAYSIAPGVSNKTFRATFEGDFNNGVYSIPIYRNDSELNDYNWNFVGNPYPSAIDADLFLAVNSNVSTDVSGTSSGGSGYIDGAIFLWSQNTPAAGNANGNEILNFSNTDYAIINAVGENAGGDGVTPSRNIPSGQGFFVSMANAPTPASLVSGDVYTTNIIFSNSMRVANTTANSQFFKSSSTKNSITNDANKFWVNLVSDNGVFNQILVGYVNGATDGDDGMAYDAAKFPKEGASIYTTILDSNKKYAIQGKDPNSIDNDEVIQLGFSTSINNATLYTLSIAQFQGDFLTENSIYLKDDLLNKLHNLSDSDYTFTSEVGEFNERFEIVFDASALSIEDNSSESTELSIVELEGDKVQFSTSVSTIKSVTIFDLLGRQLYDLKGTSASETYTLSNLRSSIFIAKIELSNGTVITKKAIKQ
ncbi:T9SS type A sorting domain-containing protein [Hyunsoonleella sp. SJ7]|uniref:T9SS type A sorting domain-containing protein n=1 Tax=Hyunsoonleella aquatilis TaxID=2762758 RepID=A0A923H6Z2_9FLAO|nr:T9SS type A sorting domain-containing protein [Hyunsoonleella aquatilis]MBC3756805.1 T9SS type A sorting domain-containing protein [Hyunsoonleella aquatilis]